MLSQACVSFCRYKQRVAISIRMPVLVASPACAVCSQAWDEVLARLGGVEPQQLAVHVVVQARANHG
jgi:hypothetical protein